jgi:hypothetical protein
MQLGVNSYRHHCTGQQGEISYIWFVCEGNLCILVVCLLSHFMLCCTIKECVKSYKLVDCKGF